jgi:hypothetical protein
MAAEAATKTLTTRNVTLVSYQLDEVQSSDDKQAEILTDILTRLTAAPPFSSYEQINEAIQTGEITEGTFVLLDSRFLNGNAEAAAPQAGIPRDSENAKGYTVVVAKYRALN